MKKKSPCFPVKLLKIVKFFTTFGSSKGGPNRARGPGAAAPPPLSTLLIADQKARQLLCHFVPNYPTKLLQYTSAGQDSGPSQVEQVKLCGKKN